MEPTPLWLLPPNFNISEQEGREAFLADLPITRHRYGESSAGADWERGWKAEEAKTRR